MFNYMSFIGREIAREKYVLRSENFFVLFSGRENFQFWRKIGKS